MSNRRWVGVAGAVLALGVFSPGTPANGQERRDSVPSTPNSSQSRETNQTRPTPLTGRDLDSSGNPDRALNTGTSGRTSDYGRFDNGRYDSSGDYMRDGNRGAYGDGRYNGDYGRYNNNAYGRNPLGYGSGGYGSSYGNYGDNWGAYNNRGNGYYYDRSYYPDSGYGYGNGGYQNGGYYSPSFAGAQAGQRGSSSQSLGTSMSTMDNNQVLIRVMVPRADASVIFNGHPTTQMGFDRLYISPPLQPGHKYAYSIKATWQDNNGKQVASTDTLYVRANELLVADFVHQPGQTLNTAAPIPNQAVGRQELSEPDRNNGKEPNAKEDAKRVITGKVSSVSGERLTITEADGVTERTFQLPAATSIQLNGKDFQANALKSGMPVTIHLKDGAQIKSIEVNQSGNAGK